ncbi:MAG TPA: HD-GYP domain-containing protein [Gaiellaceae bacterium]|nr:HD-GYP domain-containing protein [Gaiellaceae bacterium]
MTSFDQTQLGLGRTLKRSKPEPIAIFAVALALAALGLALTLILAGGAVAPAWALVVLSVLSALAEKRPVRVSPNTEITVSLLPVVFTAVVFGPLSAMVVGAAGLLVTFGRPRMRWFTWTGSAALSGGLAGVAAASVQPEDPSFGHLVVGVVVAVLVKPTVDVGLGALTVAIRGSGRFLDIMLLFRPILVSTVPLYTPILVLLVWAFESLSVWSVFLFVAPAYAAHRLHGLYREQRETTEQLRVANERLERAGLSFATALVAALDARDQYTAGHSAAVAVYARDIARRLGLSDEEQQLAHLCGLVHDIGKVGLPVGLLEKPGALTLEERRCMQEHSVIGERILAKVDNYAEIARIVRHHHERVDGNGYPDGMRGEEIPLLSRIIAVADAYNAMTSGRPYREAMPSRVARFRLAQAADTQFDTKVVVAFEAILAGAGETYLSGVRPDFTVEAQQLQPPLVALAGVGAA